MPKLIENVRQQLLEEARLQIRTQGYAKTTVRSVAGACGIAVGTVYNYFPSKEYLIASFVAEEWNVHLEAMRALDTADPEALLHGIYTQLRLFTEENRMLFSDPEAAKAISGGHVTRHLQLREQLAELIAPCASSEDGFLAQFIAEALLSWTVAGAPFERIYQVISKLIGGGFS